MPYIPPPPPKPGYDPYPETDENPSFWDFESSFNVEDWTKWNWLQLVWSGVAVGISIYFGIGG